MGSNYPEERDRLSEVIENLRKLELRVESLERRGVFSNEAEPAAPAIPVGAEPSAGPSIPAGAPAVFGKALVGIAGAYLLRALAESGSVATFIAVPVALVYAFTWLLGATRSATPTSLASATYGITAAFILSPMLWETTVRFRAIPSHAAALALALFLIAAFWLAWTRNVTAVIWISTVTVLLTCWALIVATRDVVPFAVAAVFIGIAVEYAAVRDHWVSLRWTAALTADLAILLMTHLLTRRQGLPEGYAPIPIFMGLLLPAVLALTYVGSSVFRNAARGLPVTNFEVGQMAAALFVACFAFLRILPHVYEPGVTAACFVVTIAFYALAFGVFSKRPGVERNVRAYSALGLVLAICAGYLLSPNFAVAGIGMIMCCWGRWSGNTVVMLHAAITSAVVIVASGALAAFIDVVLDPAVASFSGVVAINGFTAMAIYAMLELRPATDTNLRVALGVSAASAYTAFLGGMATALSFVPPIRSTPGLFSSICTGVVACSAILIAWAWVRLDRPELRWIAWAVLLAWGIKLVGSDLRNAHALSLAASLLVYGAALIALPRFKRVPQSLRAAAAAG